MNIAIGIITRNRPQLLEDALDSLAQLEVPEHGSLQYIVVENNSHLGMREVVRKSPLDPAKTHLELEPRLGIPFARNKVLSIAARIECDFLAFIDDDEQARPNWISELVKRQQATGADLVCGPAREQMDLTDASYLQRVVAHGITRINEREYRKIQRKNSGGTPLTAKQLIRAGDWCAAANQAANADPGALPYLLGTCNWMCRMAFIQKASLQFQESLGFGGGEDWLFGQHLRAAGGRATVAPNAIVDATVTPDRLTIRYQFHCWRERTKEHYYLKNRRRQGIARSLATSFIWFVSGLGYASRIPFGDSRAFVRSVRKFGKAVGRIEALLSHTSNLYRDTTGY